MTNLEHSCDRIRIVHASFLSLIFQHIYREHNESANGPSKEALDLDMGNLSFIEFLEGEEARFGHVSFYDSFCLTGAYIFL